MAETMTSVQHAAWLRSGGKWDLARPLAMLRDKLRHYGYTVYDLGDNSHLDHQPPEDHTPYSETGWPIKTPYGWVTAIDIMPPPAGSGLPSLQKLGGQLYADMQAGIEGVRWLKYMNWGPVSDNAAVHDSWEPLHQRSASGDTGHAHLSCRSDATQWTTGDTYDPVARLRGQTGDDMTAMNRALYDLFTALTTGVTEDGFVASVGDPTSENANIDKAVKAGAAYTTKELAGKVDALATRVDALTAAVGKLADAVKTGGTDPQVIEDAAFRAAQRAEKE